MRTLLSLLLLLCAFSAVKGQRVRAPGYAGLKLSARYHISPNLTFAHRQVYDPIRMTGWNDKRLHGIPAFRHGLVIDQVLTRTLTLGAGIEYMRTGFRWEDEDDGIVTVRHFRMSYLCPSLELRIFPLLKRGNIAPLGPFTAVKAGLDYNKVTRGKDGVNEGELVVVNRMVTTQFIIGHQGIIGDRVFFVIESFVGLTIPIEEYPDVPDEYVRFPKRLPQEYNSLTGGLQAGITAGLGLLLF